MFVCFYFFPFEYSLRNRGDCIVSVRVKSIVPLLYANIR